MPAWSVDTVIRACFSRCSFAPCVDFCAYSCMHCTRMLIDTVWWPGRWRSQRRTQRGVCHVTEALSWPQCLRARVLSGTRATSSSKGEKASERPGPGLSRADDNGPVVVPRGVFEAGSCLPRAQKGDLQLPAHRGTGNSRPPEIEACTDAVHGRSMAASCPAGSWGWRQTPARTTDACFCRSPGQCGQSSLLPALGSSVWYRGGSWCWMADGVLR